MKLLYFNWNSLIVNMIEKFMDLKEKGILMKINLRNVLIVDL